MPEWDHERHGVEEMHDPESGVIEVIWDRLKGKVEVDGVEVIGRIIYDFHPHPNHPNERWSGYIKRPEDGDILCSTNLFETPAQAALALAAWHLRYPTSESIEQEWKDRRRQARAVGRSRPPRG